MHLLAEALCRKDDVKAYLCDHGILDGDGNERPALRIEAELRKEAANYALLIDVLGLGVLTRILDA